MIRNIKVGIVFVLILCFLLTPTVFWKKHAHPFETMKMFVFVLSILLSSNLLFMACILSGKVFIPFHRLTYAVILYFTYNLIGFFFFSYTNKNDLVGLGCLILLYLIVSSIITHHNQHHLLYALFTAACVGGLYGIVQFFYGDPFMPEFRGNFRSMVESGIRIYTTLGNPNLVGGFYAALLPLIATCFLTHVRKQKYRPAFWVGIVLGVAVISLLLSQTRSAWISCVCICSVWGGIIWHKPFLLYAKQHYRKTLLFTLGGMLLFGGALWSIKHYTSLTNRSSFYRRMSYYTNTLSMIRQHPIIGQGLGTFKVYYPRYHNRRRDDDYLLEHAHNEHLELLHDGGVVGYGLFLWIIVEALWRLLKKKHLIATGVAATIGILLLDGLFSQNLRYIAISSILWLCIGFAGRDDQLTSLFRFSTLPVTNFKLVSILLVPLIMILPLRATYHAMQSDKYLKKGFDTVSTPHVSLNWFYKAHTLDPRNEYILYYLATSYQRMRRVDLAIRYFMMLRDLHPYFWVTNYELGLAFLEQGDMSNATYYFKQQIAIHNMHWQSYYQLAKIASETNHPEQVRQYIEEIRIIHNIRSIGVENLVAVSQLL